ncbi:uncharacterized protein N0V89_000436 [Didymosphaeria variabile]|uniref:RNA-dependent RNA polymerase n=1 Tax=Didymosphaeria variabile TaxID=1932322 RepID=A0A9W8XWN9_9PLEO|nr:uncharacterized protein N0V89_000436 [Didymosphaeria variabile]KAJ4359880.1 hypothetical protein N0V89_000436 [Didymosphaeria variabile]
MANPRPPPQGNRGQSAGLAHPSTPRKNGAELSALIHSLGQQWQLGLPVRDKNWSPLKSNKELPDKVYGQLKRLYWQGDFHEAIGRFVLQAKLPSLSDTQSARTARLTLLHEIIRDIDEAQGRDPGSRAAISRLRPTTPSSGLYHTSHNDNGDTHAIAPDPGSPTDEDEPPPSPITSSKAAQRRVQASPRFQMGAIARKRPSDSSDSGNSPKLTRTSKGKQPSDRPPEPIPTPIFKKPSLPEFRSHQGNKSFPTTAKTAPLEQTDSFQASSVNTSFNTISSSQRTLVDTANTSFASDVYDSDIKYPKLTRTSSTTLGSLDDQDLLDIEDPVEAQLRRELARMEELNHGSQDPPPRSSSAYGSVDEDVMLERSFTVESPSKSANDSPSKLPHYIRNIPEQKLFTALLAEDLKEFPDPSNFLEQICVNLDISFGTLRDQQKYWSAFKRGFEGYTFKARIEYNNPDSQSSSSPVFKLNVLPIQVDRSCRFQRKFGSDRFLYVNVPSFDPSENKPSRFNNEDLKNIEEQFKLWCAREHSFLGRTWKAFHVEPVKKKKKNGRTTDDLSDKRIVLFAIDGLGIGKPMLIGETINWFLPFEKNMHQAYTKANARLDLGLSRTIPTVTFKPSQIIYVKDMTADKTPEDTHFNDETIDSWPQTYPRGTVMNDGCSLISVGAALLIWQKVRKITNSDEPMPSAFQARIGGAKGVWMISGEPYSASADDHKIWIQISESQLKFKPPREDRSDGLASDPHRLTFEYVNHSRPPVPSELHISFIPILVDRGVPKDHIADLMVEQLDAKRNELIQLLPTTERLYHWIHQEGPSSSGFESPRWQAGMYQSLPDQIKHLFESGFVPEQEPYLADCLYRFIKRRQLWMESKLRVPLYQSTFVVGVADPFGILEPGELHMEFSTPFTDELTGSRLRSLDNMDILVSRQPACRRSDIQKVRAVKRPELSHLIDVVVFPTKGQYPLAGKLQGGDYDGDIFWLCWDQAMVKPFKNAPAPVESPDPAQYGIEQDTRKLSEVMDSRDLSTVNNLLKEALEFRLTPSLLGIVTSHLEKQAYYENQVFSDRLDALCDMHDLLVDAPKQGYKFTNRDFKHYIVNVLRCGNPKEPAYKEAMKDCEKKETDEGDKKRKQNYKHKKENILDYLYFEIVRKHDVATLKQVKDFFSKDLGQDPDPVLQYPYLNHREHGSPLVQRELDALVKGLKQVERKWLDITMAEDKDKKTDWYSQAVDTCYAKYRSILPAEVDHPDIKPWIYPFLRPQYSYWEEIRASTFYAVFTRRHKLVWAVAGKQLAELKAASYADSTAVVPRIKTIMKPKAPKAPRLEEDESEDEFEDALEELNT